MARIIRIDYEFEFEGKTYRAFGVNIGETIEPKPQTLNIIRSSAVCHALDIDSDEFMKRFGMPWNWTRQDWEKKGFNFTLAQEEAING